MNMMAEAFITSFIEDGGDHINVHPAGKTRIGKISSFTWRSEFFIPDVGGFLTPLNTVSWFMSKVETERHSFKPMFGLNKVLKDEKLTQIVVYSKFCQMCRLLPLLKKEKDLISLPWTSYIQHRSGIKEHIELKVDLVAKSKKMAELILNYGPKDSFKRLEELGLPPDYRQTFTNMARERFLGVH